MMNDKSTDIKKFEERGEVTVVSNGNSPAELTRLALTHGQSLADIEKMLELQIKYEKNEAKKAYYEAVAKFKENPPTITKDKYNKQFDSWYVGLGNLLEIVSGPLGEVGLSLSFPTPKQEEGSLTVECKLSHRLGHSETTSMTGPVLAGAIGKASGKPSRNALQDIKTTFTYLRSATCEAVLGMAGTDASLDSNGNSPEGEIKYVDKAQIDKIEGLLIEKESDVSMFLAWMKVDKIKDIFEVDFKKAEQALKDQKTPEREPGSDDS